MTQPYNPESYWDRVAGNISGRPDLRIIAGDDEPYYRYKRRRLLELLDRLDFRGLTVLEVGSGPGGNLAHIHRKGCQRVCGADISGRMVELARANLEGQPIEVVKTNGTELPFADAAFDVVFTSTVLQHNTDEERLRALVQEICRVAAHEVILFERIERRIKGHESNLGRPIGYYAALLADHGFRLTARRAMPLQVSYYTCGAIRRLLNPKSRKEGESLTPLSLGLQRALLPITSALDRLVPSRRDVMMLRFAR